MGQKSRYAQFGSFQLRFSLSAATILLASSNLYSSSNHFKTNFCVSFFFLRALFFKRFKFSLVLAENKKMKKTDEGGERGIVRDKGGGELREMAKGK